MWNRKRHCLFVAVACWAVLPTSPVQAAPAEPNAADLVRVVRASETWMYRIDNLQFRVEGTWTHPPESIAVRLAELKRQDPNQEPDPRHDSGLQPRLTDTLEYVIDFKNQRLRYVENATGGDRFVKIWDGTQLTCYARMPDGYEQYSLEATRESLGHLFGSLSWTKGQPHSFWWAPEDIERLMDVYGKPDEFRMAGRAEYRGVDCYLLEFEPPAAPGKTFQWYVGRDDHRLYGRIESFIEHWTLDYKGVAPGCWMPMAQGYAINSFDPNRERWYLDVQRDARIVDVCVNADLPETLFEMEWKEGVYVSDRRSGKTVVSKYVFVPPSLLGQPLPDVTGLGIDGITEQVAGQAILLCFVDTDQRPSRHGIAQLKAGYEHIRTQGVVLVAVDLSGEDTESLGQWKRDRDVPFPLGRIDEDLTKVRRTWGVRSLPWLILTDRDHVVTAEGFAVAEIGDRIK